MAASEFSCGIFVTSITVLVLVIFETLFFLFYIAPRVEEGNIRLAASSIAKGTAMQLQEAYDCSTIQGPVMSGVQAFPLPPDSSSKNQSNQKAVWSVSIVLCVAFIVVVASWFLFMRGRISFPWSSIARETLPLLCAFAMYDFMYFEFFVRTWDTGSTDEFLYSMASQIAQPT